MSPTYRVGVLGATGAVGSTILEVLAERGFPVSEVRPLCLRAFGRAAVSFGEERLEVLATSEQSIQGLDLVLSSAGGSVSAEWAPKMIAAGAVVVDNTSYWRMHPQVPLVVSEVNPEAIAEHRGLVANPNCTTMEMMVALAPIRAVGGHRAARRLDLPSGLGYRAQRDRGAARPNRRRHSAGEELKAEVYPHPIAFNVVPQVESFTDGDDYTTEERKVMAETLKILGATAQEAAASRPPAPASR